MKNKKKKLFKKKNLKKQRNDYYQAKQSVAKVINY